MFKEFEQLFKKAIGDDSEPLEDLIKKAGKPNLGSIKNLGKTGAPKLPTQQGTPQGAETKTQIQINSATQPVTKTIVTPDGPQQKTFHQAVQPITQEGVTAPKQPVAKEKKVKLIAAKTKAGMKKQQQEINHVPHKDGGTVVVGHQDGQIPVDVQLDHKSRWYHDNIKPGDHVHFHGKSEKFPEWPGAVVDSEVMAVNPNGKKVLHVKPLAAEAKNDPDATPLEVHYGDISHFMRPKVDNPHQFDQFKYNGEYDMPNPQVDAPGTPAKKTLSAEEHHAHVQHQAEIWKHRIESLKSHLEPGDIIEWHAVNPETGKLELMAGTAHNLTATASQVKKNKAQAEGKEAPDLKTIMVQTKDGYEEIPLEQIHRIGKYLMDELHMFRFDPDKLKWTRDGKAGQEVTPVEKEQKPNPNPVPHTMPHPETPGMPQVLDAKGNTVIPHPAQEPASTLNETEPSYKPLPKEKSHIIMNAGGQFIGEDHDDNTVIFQDPVTKQLHIMPADEVTPEAVHEKLAKKPAEAAQPKSATPDYEDKTPDITQHWTHILPEDLVSHIGGILDKVNAMRKKGEDLPPSVLAASHSLMHDYDPIKAAKNAAMLDKFVQNPSAIPAVKPPLKPEDFANKLNTKDFSSVSLPDAIDKLGSNRPAHHFLQKKQTDALVGLLNFAKEHGLTEGPLGNTFNNLNKIDTTKDNRQLIQFLRHQIQHYADKQGIQLPPAVTHVPTDEQIQMADHLHHMANYMNKEHLNIPAYEKKLGQLNYFLDTAPDSPIIPKMMNELHRYVYNSGTNDPLHQLYGMRLKLDDLTDKDANPQIVDKMKSILDMAQDGKVPPEVAQERIAQYAKAAGLKWEAPPPMDYDRAAWLRGSIDNMMQHRKTMNEYANIQKELKADQAKMKQGNTEAPVAKQPMDAHDVNQQVQQTAKSAKKHLSFIKNNYQQYLNLLDTYSKQPQSFNDKDIEMVQGIYDSLNRFGSEYANDVKTLGEAGVSMPQFDMSKLPKPPKTSGQKSIEKEQGKGKDWDKLSDDLMSQNMSHQIRWLKDSAAFAHNDINATRAHFMARADNHFDSVAKELKDIDAAVGQMLDSQQWKPLPDVAQTPQGRQFIALVNQKIEHLRKREQIAGISLDEALGKSMSDVLSAEKTLARRDISLALRKAFCNDKSSPEVRHATQLLGAYTDDFIDTVMGCYKNIPLSVRKSITRKLLRAMINEVIRDNEYSAALMRDDFTAPLNEKIVKSLGRKIAGVVTEFRMEAEPEQLFVVDMAKSVKNKPCGKCGRTDYNDIRGRLCDKCAFDKSLYFEHNHAQLRGLVQFSNDKWFTLLSDLEDCMYKANFYDNRVSEHRIRKFIVDNDQKSLIDFYNENVDMLNERLERVK